MVEASPKTKLVNLRVPPDELAAWQARAAEASMTLTAWLRQQAARASPASASIAPTARVRSPLELAGLRVQAGFRVAERLAPGAATPKRKDK